MSYRLAAEQGSALGVKTRAGRALNTQRQPSELQRGLPQEYIADFVNVAKSYRSGSVIVPALRGISCRIPIGETTYVVGPSGSGKTTFLNLLGVIDKPDTGSITIMGTDVGGLSDGAAADFRSRSIGYIFQHFSLIPVLSAKENVEYTLLRRRLPRMEREDRAEKYLRAVGLQDMLDRRPGALSGGQQQRVAIARALAGEPAMIIADEPTANLDSRTSREIVELMARIQQDCNTTFVFCTHDMELIRGHGNLLHIVDGQIEHSEKSP
ncbi:ABC transporter ATP-binding protein [Inquilinus sp. OTU3971]|uniref:ABC transporter ATP-binding protein n=1 Tax=Inquilinus sp. OTU3971 TaxID=3043855 RepID=UPI00313DBE43